MEVWIWRNIRGLTKANNRIVQTSACLKRIKVEITLQILEWELQKDCTAD